MNEYLVRIVGEETEWSTIHGFDPGDAAERYTEDDWNYGDKDNTRWVVAVKNPRTKEETRWEVHGEAEMIFYSDLVRDGNAV